MKILAKYNKEGNYIDTVDIDQYNEQIAANHEAILSAGEITDADMRPILRKVDVQRTPEELLKIVQRKQEDDRYAAQQNVYDDYKPLEEKQPTSVGKYQRTVAHYEDTDSKIIVTYTLETDPDAVNSEIRTLQAQLSATDYIIIKTYEAKLLGESQPYSDDELEVTANQRKELRTKINELQKLL